MCLENFSNFYNFFYKFLAFEKYLNAYVHVYLIITIGSNKGRAIGR